VIPKEKKRQNEEEEEEEKKKSAAKKARQNFGELLANSFFGGTLGFEKFGVTATATVAHQDL
jgi:hypothetical protein